MKALGLWLLVGTLCFSASAKTALQPTNPNELCARYLGEEPIQLCKKEMKKLGPDWYLATICGPVFEDKDFWDCLKMSKKANFSPKQLATCDVDGQNDVDKMNCLKNLVSKNSKASAYQDAKIKAKTKKSKKKSKA